VQPHPRIRDGLQTSSSIFSDFRWVAAFEPCLSKSVDRARWLSAIHKTIKRGVESDPLSVRCKVMGELPQDRAKQGNPHEAP
jgi:hypothetical protein